MRTQRETDIRDAMRGSLYVREEIESLEAKVDKLEAENKYLTARWKASSDMEDRLETKVAKLEAALKRLASPEAFYMSRATNEEDVARMQYAEAALKENA